MVLEASVIPNVAGIDPRRSVDAIFVNAPIRDYSIVPRMNDFTLPVLGMAYIATYCQGQGFNVGLLDAEALGLSPNEVTSTLNTFKPRWVGFNLLAPTYELSAQIALGLDDSILIMLGSHHAKAMPREITEDRRFRNLGALVTGEAEIRAARLLDDIEARHVMPGVWWRDPISKKAVQSGGIGSAEDLAPDLDLLPVVDRVFLAQDPFEAEDGRVEANMVGARGCPYNCTFCGAAAKTNPDIKIRTRNPDRILAEMMDLADTYGVNAVRFVDDLFLGYPVFIERWLKAFERMNVGDRFLWDATGRINILDKLTDTQIHSLAMTGCREVALGIESGSERLLSYMGKRINPEMTVRVVTRLLRAGISVKGYFILGMPTETRSDLHATMAHVRQLWRAADAAQGDFRASAFEFRPYPNTIEWHRLIASGRFTVEELLDYAALDLRSEGLDEAMRERDEFNFSVNLQFGEVGLVDLRSCLIEIAREQYARRQRKAA